LVGVGSGPIYGVAKLVSMNDELATKIIIDAKLLLKFSPNLKLVFLI